MLSHVTFFPKFFSGFNSSTTLDWATFNSIDPPPPYPAASLSVSALRLNLDPIYREFIYILDEPTIGLHPRDNNALLGTLQALKKKGNSLLLVEHDEDTIKAATHLIDLGPGAGVEGGEIVASLTRTELNQKKRSRNTFTITDAAGD